MAAVVVCIGVVWGVADPFAAIRENHLAALKGADLAVRDPRDNALLIYAGRLAARMWCGGCWTAAQR